MSVLLLFDQVVILGELWALHEESWLCCFVLSGEPRCVQIFQLGWYLEVPARDVFILWFLGTMCLLVFRLVYY